MNIKFLAKTGIVLGSILVSLFALFIIFPFILNIFIDKYTPQIVGEINKATGLSAGIQEVKIVTAPNLSAGLKVKKFELYTPNKEPIINADNFEVRMSLLPLFAKSIKVDTVKLDKADIVIKFNNDGEIDFLKYMPVNEQESKDETDNTTVSLPFGFKLSNHLPDFHLGEYKLNLTDGVDNYVVSGNKTDITNFIINKSIKFKGSGKFVLKDREQFRYNINLYNHIMPETDINELVFNTQSSEEKQNTGKVNIISILKGIYECNLTTDVYMDLVTSKDSIDGKVAVTKLSLVELPYSDAELIFKGNTIKVNSDIYTANNEVSKLQGQINTGKKPMLDMNLKSDIEIANLLNIVKRVALVFNIEDLKTLSANGRLNADFNIKTDLKNVVSNGYLKLPSANVYYGIYKTGLDNINADIAMADNNIDIKNISFSVLGQPLRIFGKLTHDADLDIHITADKLGLKGLLIAAGQASLMKDNKVNAGVLTMDVLVKGKMDKINPVVKLNIDNVDIKNVPLDIRLLAPSTKINITSDGSSFGGTAISDKVKLINPAASVTAPVINANIQPDYIEILKTPISIEKINTTVSGKITDYMTDKIGLDFITSGDIQSTLKGDMNILKQTLNLVYATTDMSTIIVPMFDKSKMSFKGKLNITGSMMNPTVSGTVNIPSLTIPEIPITMSDMDIKMHGTILHGSATVKNFSSGGIKAQNLYSDFELKGNDFYLNNIKGTAFKGKINGDIIYNLVNAKTKISFKGTGMDAEQAIEGGSGIKNALSGLLSFNANLGLTVQDYSDMMKSMTGDLTFDITDGAFGTIGRFDGFLGAANITQNYILKNTVTAISNAAGLATTAQFKLLDGKLNFSDGWTYLNPVKSKGSSLCYYITGKYNLINGSTNVVILGRLDAPMVAKLGVLGTLDLADFIGDTASTVVKILTLNPQGEKTEYIPTLSNGSENYQDFKVVFNGGVDSKNSVKSFKWLKKADIANYEKQTVKTIVNSVQEAYKTDIETTKESINNSIETKKKEVKKVKEQINTTKDDFKNLWKSIKDTGKSESETVKKSSELQNEQQSSAKNTVEEASSKQQEAAQQKQVSTEQTSVKEQTTTSANSENSETKSAETEPVAE